MKILFVIPYAPSLIRVRSYNMIREISLRGHEVTLATLWAEEHELEGLEALRGRGVKIIAQRMPLWRSVLNCLLALPAGEPLQSAYSWHPGLADQIIGLLEGRTGKPCDIVHVEHLRGARYAQYIQGELSTKGRSIPIVWDSVDCISYLFQQTTESGSMRVSRWIAGLERSRTERLERVLSQRFEKTLVTSETDRTELIRLSDGDPSAHEKVKVVTNGVDLDYFRADTSSAPEPATVVLTGKMSYHANVAMVDYFANRVFPVLKRRHPQVKVRIVGKDPPSRIKKLGEDPRITVTGMVPDMRPFLQSATVAAVPLTYGAGVQNKVLEAMACATPVVASPLAARALQAEQGREILLAETPEEYVQHISELIGNPIRRREIGRAGRRYVEKYHDWSVIAADLEEIYLGINGH